MRKVLDCVCVYYILAHTVHLKIEALGRQLRTGEFERPMNPAERWVKAGSVVCVLCLIVVSAKVVPWLWPKLHA